MYYAFKHSGLIWNLEVLVFEERGKPGSTRGKTSRSRERTNNKLSPHMVRAQNRTRGHIGGRLHQPCSPSQNQKIEAVQKFEWCLCSIGAYVCHLEIKLRWNKLLCSQEIVNRHFERKECFSAASCKVLCEFLTEANVRYLLSDACRIMTSMPMFATYRVKVEIIISEVLTGVLWESRAWKLCTCKVRKRLPNFLLVIEICPNSLPRQRQFMFNRIKCSNMLLPVNTWCLYCGRTHAHFY